MASKWQENMQKLVPQIRENQSEIRLVVHRSQVSLSPLCQYFLVDCRLPATFSLFWLFFLISFQSSYPLL